ncbi:Serine--tRNA ligase, mitochondrial [Yamadazyma tenuis]|uniref:serine--tRNA ligase n=1 Tax=Candida tenuis (strain ATCC 10573 / BCRC 21748 / CBS 615 / JCM 9827 / NBRC 10315 / NRRL Y-1498 / VKM Y-70) TaxID=590646 RepID=G3B6T4_CANTC|nr:seryl-tRNA synthetase [Yamadazyma tenuis ATCC 10573]EGV63014.1 seryl-tRNA synthetase [Yamadazyma tenuis ATCC 10573]WEJ97167.1 Serine--tRNA ligase, mitochondrial [Yamadazyma tenuis]
MRLLRYYSILPKPNLEIRSIITNKDAYKDSILKRETKNLLHNLETVASQRPQELELIARLNSLKHKRAQITKSITPENKQTVLPQLADIKKSIKSLEPKVDELSATVLANAEALPNLIDPSVKSHQQVVEYLNVLETEIPSPLPEDDETLRVFDHKTIGERKGIFEFAKASKISGSSWYYLVGDGALLENALVQYALAQATHHHYQFVIPPTIVKNEVIKACGFKPKDQHNEQQIYEISDSDSSLIGTCEIPLAGYHANINFQVSEQFPKKYVGLSRSFRAEAGSRGRDTKGLYRVHEFTKLELFHYTTPESSALELEQLMEFQKSLIKNLGLKAKVINIPYNDLGAPAYKKYDIEAWMPGRNSWGELTSSSNCTDYQSRRLNIRYFDQEKNLKYVHTLNGTAMAVPRVIVAIVEQNYDPVTDQIKIPDVLVPLMGKKYI